MGTWGDGLYDNDSALDELADLVTVDPDAATLVTQLGLRIWLDPSGLESIFASLTARLDALADDPTLPADTRAALALVRADPDGSTRAHARSDAVRAVLGGYADGPRIDALLRFPGAQPAIDALGERAAKRLDALLAATTDLYQIAGDLAALGVVLELAQAGLHAVPVARVARWRAGFDAIDKHTKHERGFWWKYVRRVHRGFDLLAPSTTSPPKPAKPVVRKRPAAAPAPSVAPERWTHPKFGAATLIARSSSGEALELRFDDGEVRKVLARFCTRLDP